MGLSRRNWLKASSIFTASLGLSRWNSSQATTKPAASLAAEAFTKEHMVVPPGGPKLRARLLANENPLGIAPSAKQAIIDSASSGNRYAWSEFGPLKKLIADNEGIKPEHVMMSPGSSDMLLAAAELFTKGGGTILTCRPTYEDLLKKSTFFGGTVKALPLTKEFKYDLPAIQAALTPDVKLVYIVNPNNPTGTILPPAELEAFCRAVAPKVPVFIDEAYIDFLSPTDRPMLGKLVAEGLNVILARTFSKIHGFAGLRLGYAIAQPAMLEAMHQYIGAEHNISVTTLMAGTASYQDIAWQNHCRTENAKARDFTVKALTEMGYEVIPSFANFMLFPIRMKGKAFSEQMMAQGIGIQTRDIDGQPYCRVSIGTMEEMGMFVDSFKKVVG
ncbi:pyridoxal phosphate-dependent aminotransferase [Fibrella aquatica]|uniref:pyridoxal phosphate-dependent aminotransferase n=1 Tax=Fibrella aquatica TaxID=3242487 RepID=UPI0035226E2F